MVVHELTHILDLGRLYPESGFRPVEDGASAHGTKRPRHPQGGERPADGRFGEAKAKITRGNNEDARWGSAGSEFGEG